MDWATTIDVADGCLDAGDDLERAIAIRAAGLPDEKPGPFSITADVGPDIEQLVSLPFAQQDCADLWRIGKVECMHDMSRIHGSPLTAG